MIPKEGKIGFRLAMTTQRERQGQCSVSYTYVGRINAFLSCRGKSADDIQYPDTTSSAGGYDAGVDIRAGAHSDYGASRVLVIISPPFSQALRTNDVLKRYKDHSPSYSSEKTNPA